MAWSGSWNSDRTAYTGTYTAPDGTVFTGTWTVWGQNSGSTGPLDPPLLSYYDPYVGRIGAAADDSTSVEKAWNVTWNGHSYSGKYRAPDGSAFEGTITPP